MGFPASHVSFSGGVVFREEKSLHPHFTYAKTSIIQGPRPKAPRSVGCAYSGDPGSTETNLGVFIVGGRKSFSSKKRPPSPPKKYGSKPC